MKIHDRRRVEETSWDVILSASEEEIEKKGQDYLYSFYKRAQKVLGSLDSSITSKGGISIISFKKCKAPYEAEGLVIEFNEGR